MYKNIFLANFFLPGNNGVAVTVMSYSGGGSSIEPGFDTERVQNFTLYWGPIVYSKGADDPNYRDTLIHELTHVWQGYNENALIFNYMVRSLVAQGYAIGTKFDRGAAYNYDSSNYLKWSEYNVEQQADIVEEWYSFAPPKNGGSLSVFDPRFVYIEKVIRARKPGATDTPKTVSAQAQGQISSNYSPFVEMYQRLLIKKGYKIKHDGDDGNNTKKAVRDFQKKKGLRVTGVVDAQTLAKLKQP